MFRFASKNLLEKKKLSKHKMEAGTSVMSSSEFISRIDFISKQDQKKKKRNWSIFYQPCPSVPVAIQFPTGDQN